MEVIGPLISQGGFALLAAVFLYLYIQERKEHREDLRADQAIIREIQDARLNDQRESGRETTAALQANGQAMTILSEKIEIGKRNGERP